MRQPLRDLVWLLRGGPPPGPAIDRGPEEEMVRDQGELSNFAVDRRCIFRAANAGFLTKRNKQLQEITSE